MFAFRPSFADRRSGSQGRIRRRLVDLCRCGAGVGGPAVSGRFAGWADSGFEGEGVDANSLYL